MKHINLTIILFFILLTGAFIWQSCVKEELDFEKFSKTIDYDPQLHAPLIRGSLTIAEINEDEHIIIRGDTVIYYLRWDTIYKFDVEDFVEIPDQGAQNYHIASRAYDTIFPASMVYTKEQKDSFQIVLEHNMRLDSLLTNTGMLVMDISSNFSSIGELRIQSPSLFINNQEFDTIIPFSRQSGDYFQVHNIPLTNAKIVVDNTNPDYSKMEVNFTVMQAVQAGDTIKANSFTDIDFSIQNLEDFESAFGYAGDTTFTKDTVIVFDTIKIIEGFSGEFAATNPKININYTHSLGIPVGFDMNITGYFKDKSNVVLQPSRQNLLISEDYRNPEITSSFLFNQENTVDIEDIFVFPVPDSIGYNVTVLANPDKDENTQNYIHGNSELLLDLELEIPLEFKADLQFKETYELNIENNKYSQYIEYANLHYWFRNEFPLDIKAKLVLLDSLNNIVGDTIMLNNLGSQLLLEAAPVDAEGFTLRDQVIEKRGMMELNQDQILNLFNVADKVIVIGELIKAENTQDLVYGSVVILGSYRLDFKFGIETKAHYQGPWDSINNLFEKDNEDE